MYRKNHESERRPTSLNVHDEAPLQAKINGLTDSSLDQVSKILDGKVEVPEYLLKLHDKV